MNLDRLTIMADGTHVGYCRTQTGLTRHLNRAVLHGGRIRISDQHGKVIDKVAAKNRMFRNRIKMLF